MVPVVPDIDNQLFDIMGRCFSCYFFLLVLIVRRGYKSKDSAGEFEDSMCNAMPI